MIASVFHTGSGRWFDGDEPTYQARKQEALAEIPGGAGPTPRLRPEHYATASCRRRGLAHWKQRRPFGFVGGPAQRPFPLRAPFVALASRTPLAGLSGWRRRHPPGRGPPQA